jgi:hypothetical protein
VIRWVGLILLVLGILAVAYGGFWTTKEEHKAEIGPLQVKVEERERVNVPVWVGAGLAVAGAVLLLVPRVRAS